MKWNRRLRGLTMFVFNFGVESLEQSVKLGRLVIFDFLGNSLLYQKVVLCTVFSLLELFFSCCIIVEHLLKTPAIVSLANFQRLRHPKFAFDWLSVSFFDYWPIGMSGLLLLCTELTLFCTELHENCIYLNQSELSNFFMFNINGQIAKNFNFNKRPYFKSVLGVQLV